MGSVILPIGNFWHSGSTGCIYILSAHNYEILLIASHFNGLYYVILGSAFAFHMVYGSIMGLIASRLYVLRQNKKEFTRQRVSYEKRFKHRFDNE